MPRIYLYGPGQTGKTSFYTDFIRRSYPGLVVLDGAEPWDICKTGAKNVLVVGKRRVRVPTRSFDMVLMTVLHPDGFATLRRLQ